ncbi:MAG: hypothetical protein D3923_00945 [Candidatus Electrothrix sp. AR3]|nr:hypothetical protein [Candidatus Electrothrix sp. AR3]
MGGLKRKQLLYPTNLLSRRVSIFAFLFTLKKRGASKTILESKAEQVEQARAQDQAATQALDNYCGTIRKMSKTVHPFKLDDNKPQDSANVEKKLREQAKNIEVLACTHDINDKSGVMNKFKNKIK